MGINNEAYKLLRRSFKTSKRVVRLLEQEEIAKIKTINVKYSSLPMVIFFNKYDQVLIVAYCFLESVLLQLSLLGQYVLVKEEGDELFFQKKSSEN